MELKKSYKGFILWLIFFLTVLFSMAFLPIEDDAVLIRIVVMTIISLLTLLMFIIYKTEYIYWFNGIEYEDALKAGSEKRKEYGYKHFIRFLKFNLLFLIYTFFSYYLKIPFWIDIVAATIGIIAVAFSTINIKL